MRLNMRRNVRAFTPTAFQIQRNFSTQRRFSPVLAIADIQCRCQPVLERAQLHAIAWTGVFGSFSRNEQTEKSDVDLLLGYRKDASSDDIWYTGDVSPDFRDVLGRPVDCLYLQNGQILSLVNCIALKQAKTIYEQGDWLANNKLRAEAMIHATSKKMKTVLQQERLLQDCVQNISKQVSNNVTRIYGNVLRTDMAVKSFMEMEALPVALQTSLAALADLLYRADVEQAAIDGYFAPAFRWALQCKDIVGQVRSGRFCDLSTEGKEELWTSLSVDLPRGVGYLKSMYMPFVEEMAASITSK